MSASGIRAGRAFVELGVDDKMTRALQNAQAKMRAFANGIQSVGAGLATSGIALGTPIAFAAGQFANFDDAMRGVGAIAQATDSQLASMTATAAELGRTTSFTSQEVALLMQELAKGGFDPSQINKMTLAVLDLARATGTDAALSASIMKNTIKQFGLEAQDATRIADVLTKTANSTNTTVESIGESMVYAATSAKRLGMSVEETAAFIGLLGDRGIDASSAGTALRRIASIASAAGAELKSIFNVSNVDPAGNLKPLSQILTEIGESTALMSAADASKALSDAFGLLGMDAAHIISTSGPAFEQLVAKLKEAEGVANSTAKSMDAGLGGAFRRILSAVDGVANAMGGSIEGGLSKLTDAFTGALGGVTSFIDANQTLAQVVAITAGGLVAGGVALVGLSLAARAAAIGIDGAILAIKAAGIAVTIMRTAFTAAKASVLLLQGVMLASQGTFAGVAAGVALVNAAQAMSPLYSAAMAASFSAAGAIVSAVSAGLTGLAGALGTAWTSAAGISSISWTGFGAVLAGLTLPTGIAASAAGILGAAWTTVAGAATSAWTAMIAPLIPFLVPLLQVAVVLGGVTALVGVAAAKAGLFATAWGGVKTVLADLWSVAKSTFDGITTAMAGGQYATAAAILWQGVKAAFWTGMAAIADGLGYFFSNFLSGAVSFGKALISTLWNFFTAIPKMLWKALTSGKSLGEILSDAMSGIGSAFQSFESRAKTARLELVKMNNEAKKANTIADVFSKQAERLRELEKAKTEADNRAKGITPEQAETDKEDDLFATASSADRAKYLAAKKQIELLEAQAEERQFGDAGETGNAELSADNDPNAGRNIPEVDSEDLAKSIEERVAALREEAATLTQGKESAERYKFAQQGATEAQLAALDAANEAKQAAKLQSDIQGRIDALRDEAIALKYGSAVAERYKLAQMGATAAQLEGLKSAQQAAEQARLADEVKQDGESLADAMRSPFEIFRDELQRSQSLLAEGAIDGTTARRAKSVAQKRFLEDNDTPEERKETFREQQTALAERVQSGQLTPEQASVQLQAVARLLEMAKQSAVNAGKQMDEQTTGAGTFSGFAAARMNGVSDRFDKITAEASQATAANTAEIAAKLAKPQKQTFKS